MGPYELNFFEFHLILYESSLEAVDKLHKSGCYYFAKENFGLTPKQLIKVNPTQLSALIGELYHQPIKTKNQEIKTRILKFALPLKKIYEQANSTAKLAFKNRGYPGNSIASKSQTYREGYENGYTIALLNSELSLFEKGFRLGILATNLGKKGLNELRIFNKRSENSVSQLILQDPDFLKCFTVGLKYDPSKTGMTTAGEICAPSDHNETANHSPGALASGECFDPFLMSNQKSPQALISEPFPSNAIANDSGQTLNNFHLNYFTSEMLPNLVDLSSINSELAMPPFPPLAEVASNYDPEDKFATAHFVHQSQQTGSPLALSLPLYCANSVSGAKAPAYKVTNRQVPLATSGLKLFANNNGIPNQSRAGSSQNESRKRYQFFSQASLPFHPLPSSSLDHDINASRCIKKSKITS